MIHNDVPLEAPAVHLKSDHPVSGKDILQNVLCVPVTECSTQAWEDKYACDWDVLTASSASNISIRSEDNTVDGSTNEFIALGCLFDALAIGDADTTSDDDKPESPRSRGFHFSSENDYGLGDMYPHLNPFLENESCFTDATVVRSQHCTKSGTFLNHHSAPAGTAFGLGYSEYDYLDSYPERSSNTHDPSLGSLDVEIFPRSDDAYDGGDPGMTAPHGHPLPAAPSQSSDQSSSSVLPQSQATPFSRVPESGALSSSLTPLLGLGLDLDQLNAILHQQFPEQLPSGSHYPPNARYARTRSDYKQSVAQAKKLRSPQQNSSRTIPKRNEALAKPKRASRGDKSHLKCSWTPCVYQAPKKYALEYHENIHTGRKPYICPFDQCNKAFPAKTNMMRHFKKHKAGNYQDFILANPYLFESTPNTTADITF